MWEERGWPWKGEWSEDWTDWSWEDKHQDAWSDDNSHKEKKKRCGQNQKEPQAAAEPQAAFCRGRGWPK